MASREKAITNQLLKETAKHGSRLFRNNCGTAQFAHGQFVKYGVANPGGSDLIGWTPVTITADMVGKRVAVFSALEIKTPGVSTTPEQARFVEAVRRDGGFAAVVRTVEDGVAALGPKLV